MTLTEAEIAAIETAMSTGAPAGPASPARRALPTLTSSAPGIDSLYEAALLNVFVVNTLRGERGPFVRAGGGYPTPWTRDAAINSWSALSLLAPGLAESTLRAVTEDGDAGPIVAQDDQWWDQAIWVVAARRHVALTGDVDFAAWAHQVGRNTLEALEERRDPRWNLYTGPAVMQDGVAGFPMPDGAEESTAFVLDYPWAGSLMCLSTNLVYAAAFDALAALADRIGEPAEQAIARAGTIRAAIEEHLWTGQGYAYLRHTDGRLEHHQELLGLALALEHGGIDDDRVRSVVAGLHRSAHGIALVWPHFPRYCDERPGRHNVALWPMAMGQWAVAAAGRGQIAAFSESWHDLCRLVEGSGREYFELYSATDGQVHGGWQTGRLWASEPHQTWSATAFLRMVHEGLLGIRMSEDGLRLRPTLPEGVEDVTVRNLQIGRARLTVEVTGRGNRVEEVVLDTQTRADPDQPIPLAELSGDHTLRVRVW
ncbi:hypothetical protein LQF12_01075 [Ruania suaedae]|uniref:hypothetical protein n=1 Tax=Ruania suaedae TaxID=2897774 RepID=UPI001E2D8DB8|nr:hypothetical protein [Ruania suaedae]UFU03236.1 hypothetical protein LQF12_01075 [Ruania suaedae]